MRLRFRVLDANQTRAQKIQAGLCSSLRAHGIEADVCQVFEHLELSRAGLVKTPALEMNGVVIEQGRDLTPDLLDDICRRLVRARTKLGTRGDR